MAATDRWAPVLMPTTNTPWVEPGLLLLLLR
jgi:hypothetical protein